MNTDGTPRSDSPAPDGEEYFVMSLYFAAHRWGDGAGPYDYDAQANRLAMQFRHIREQETDPFRAMEMRHAAHRDPLRSSGQGRICGSLIAATLCDSRG